MGQKSKNGPSRAPHPPVRAVYPPGVGLLVQIPLEGRRISGALKWSGWDLRVGQLAVLGLSATAQLEKLVETKAALHRLELLVKSRRFFTFLRIFGSFFDFYGQFLGQEGF